MEGGEKEGKGGEEGDEESAPLVAFFSCPFNTLFSFTIPSCDDDHEGNYAMTFLASLFYVALLSDVCLFLAQSIAKASTAPASVVGATLLALGAQVPDTIGSLAMAKSGMCDGAISNAIGSQVINVTVSRDTWNGWGFMPVAHPTSPVLFQVLVLHVTHDTSDMKRDRV